MTDDKSTGELDLLVPAEPGSKPRRRKMPPAKPAATAPAPLVPVGGFMGLWQAITGRPEGAAATGDTGLTSAFIVCILFGTALCFVGALDIPFARQIGFAGPLLATFAYPIWGAAIGAATRPSLRERLADNSYYLGFIFTQIALLTGFLPAAFGSAELSADKIIRFFGVALGASLIGLVARTILTQMSYSIDEAADVVSGEVSALAREVSKQSSAVLKEFDGLVGRLRASQENLTTELQTSMKVLTETVVSFDQSLKSDAAALHKEVLSASTANDRISTGVEAGRTRLTESIDEIALVIERLKSALELQLREATDSIKATTQAVQRGVTSIESVRDLEAGITLVDEKLNALGTRILGVDARLTTSTSALDQSLRSLDGQIERTTQRGLERAESINADANEVVAALGKTLAGFRSELERLRG